MEAAYNSETGNSNFHAGMCNSEKQVAQWSLSIYVYGKSST